MTRDPLDFYPTPARIADYGARLAMRHGARILDPCAGDGALMRAVERVRYEPLGIEIDPTRAREAGAICADALAVEWPEHDVVLLNPPFCSWQAFIERAVAKPTIVWLRLGALASKGRREWWKELSTVRGIALHVSSERPSFTANGRNGSDDYAWVEITPEEGRGLSWF